MIMEEETRLLGDMSDLDESETGDMELLEEMPPANDFSGFEEGDGVEE
ncbi:MAG: hypothetical protein HQL66_15795 [Magnetococcales bacterium]|nr:hypothetical protein [Magnetococcales bacterium]